MRIMATSDDSAQKGVDTFSMKEIDLQDIEETTDDLTVRHFMAVAVWKLISSSSSSSSSQSPAGSNAFVASRYKTLQEIKALCIVTSDQRANGDARQDCVYPIYFISR